MTAYGRRHHIKKGTGLLIGESEDDIRDNVFNYDEQGGGEEDEVRFQRSQIKRGGLNHPVVKTKRMLLGSVDVEFFMNVGVKEYIIETFTTIFKCN